MHHFQKPKGRRIYSENFTKCLFLFTKLLSYKWSPKTTYKLSSLVTDGQDRNVSTVEKAHFFSLFVVVVVVVLNQVLPLAFLSHILSNLSSYPSLVETASASTFSAYFKMATVGFAYENCPSGTFMLYLEGSRNDLKQLAFVNDYWPLGADRMLISIVQEPVNNIPFRHQTWKRTSIAATNIKPWRNFWIFTKERLQIMTR